MKWYHASLLLTILLPGTAQAGPYPQAERYFALREKHPVAADAVPEAVQKQPAAFQGKLVEVRGLVVGSVQREGGSSFLINAAPHTWMVEADDAAVVALLQLRTPVRVLCRVAAVQGTETGTLIAVSAVSESDAEAWERIRAEQARKKQEQEALRRAAQLRAQQHARNPALASRGAPQAATPVDVGPSEAELVQAYARAVRYFNRRLSQAQAERIARNIIVYSVKYNLDARLVMAVVACESNFNPRAVSRAGAMGLGQLMPGTARGLGVDDPFNPEQNLEGSTRLLSGHLRTFARKRGKITEREIRLALACYNAGAGAVNRYRGIPPYRETRNYIKKVTRLYRLFCGDE